MKTVKNIQGELISIYEYKDFSIGDSVQISPRHIISNIPDYLKSYPLYVIRKTGINIIVGSSKLSGETWVVYPGDLVKL